MPEDDTMAKVMRRGIEHQLKNMLLKYRRNHDAGYVIDVFENVACELCSQRRREITMRHTSHERHQT